MNYLVCMDDTDMPGTRGTGWLVEDMCGILARKEVAVTSAISRHQLFVHEDIPYTSHNSSMCFEMQVTQGSINAVIDFMADFLEKRSEKGSDPGLCVTELRDGLDCRALIEFGQNAKCRVSSKSDAYAMARSVGVHLSEHGGTGQGVVGAVAGIGLRLSGNDGRYRGWYHLGRPGDIVSVKSLCAYPFVDGLVTREGRSLALEETVRIGSEKTKTVRMGHRQVIVVTDDGQGDGSGVSYRTITKKEAKEY